MAFWAKLKKQRQSKMPLLLCIVFVAACYHYFPVDWNEVTQVLLAILMLIGLVIIAAIVTVAFINGIKKLFNKSS